MAKNKLKSKQDLLDSFKKANKIRRQVLANRAGFDSPDEYRDHLVSQICKEVTNLTIHNIHLIDASGSMFWQYPTKFSSAKLGMNKELELLKEDKENTYLQTVISFAERGRYDINIDKQPINLIEVIEPTEFQGGTALYDSITKLLDNLTIEKSEKVLVKIFTDGKDQHSSFNGLRDARAAIKNAESKGVTVTFVGTQQDVDFCIDKLRIESTNTLVHDNTPQAVLDSFSFTAQATTTYATRAAAGEDVLKGFYKQQGTL